MYLINSAFGQLTSIDYSPSAHVAYIQFSRRSEAEAAKLGVINRPFLGWHIIATWSDTSSLCSCVHLTFSQGIPVPEACDSTGKGNCLTEGNLSSSNKTEPFGESAIRTYFSQFGKVEKIVLIWKKIN